MTVIPINIKGIYPAFAIGEKVHIDGDESITATVIGFLLRAQGPQYEAAWFNNGAHTTAWVDEFRLTLKED